MGSALPGEARSTPQGDPGIAAGEAGSGRAAGGASAKGAGRSLTRIRVVIAIGSSGSSRSVSVPSSRITVGSLSTNVVSSSWWAAGSNGAGGGVGVAALPGAPGIAARGQREGRDRAERGERGQIDHGGVILGIERRRRRGDRRAARLLGVGRRDLRPDGRVAREIEAGLDPDPREQIEALEREVAAPDHPVRLAIGVDGEGVGAEPDRAPRWAPPTFPDTSAPRPGPGASATARAAARGACRRA